MRVVKRCSIDFVLACISSRLFSLFWMYTEHEEGLHWEQVAQDGKYFPARDLGGVTHQG